MNVFGNNNVPTLLSEGVKRLERVAKAAAKKGDSELAGATEKKLKIKEEEGAKRNTPKKIKRAFKTHKNFKKLTGRGSKEYKARMALARKEGLGVGDFSQEVANRTMSPEEQEKMKAQRKEWKGKLKKPGKQAPPSDLLQKTHFSDMPPFPSVKPKVHKDHQEHSSLLDRVEENRSRKTAKKRLSDMKPLTSKAKGALKKHLRKNPGQIDSLAMKHGSENLGRIYNPDSEK